MGALRAIVAGGLGVAALLATACLDPDEPVLATKDTDPPRLVSTDPAANSLFDRGTPILVTFSEKMDPRSLRPGLFLFEESNRIPTAVEIPPETANIPDAVQQTDVPYTVRVTAEQGFKANTQYTLVFDPVLTDTEGNRIVAPDGGVGQFALGFRTTP